jgi:hypothetical protein
MPKKPAKRRPPGINARAKKITFDFIKSSGFRVIHVNGIFGGMSPRGELQIALYSERWPIPTKVVHELTDTGAQGTELKRDVRDAVLREVEVQAMMSLDTAKHLQKWLETKIKEMEKTLERGRVAEEKQ